MIQQPLIPMAPNMLSLLNALKDMPFFSDKDASETDHSWNSSGERSDSLSTLMTILSDQAEQDGFRLITINTEPKRVIMACNRQGKPPPHISSEDLQSSSSSDMSKYSTKRNGRAGTSIRCGCRMRVNINFHSKIFAWRITSYEHIHNHEYGSSIVVDEQTAIESCPKLKEFILSSSDVRHAIELYKSRLRPSDSDVARVLTSLSLPSADNSSENDSPPSEKWFLLKKPHLLSLNTAQACETPLHTPIHREDHRVTFHTATVPSLDTRQAEPPESPLPGSQHEPRRTFNLGYDCVSAAPIKNNDESSSFNFPLRSAPLRDSYINLGNSTPLIETRFPILNRRSSNLNMDSELTSKNNQQKGNAPLKELATTAIEIDRYAMLHSSFKKVIAIACKKREWSEECLSLLGYLKTSFEASSDGVNQTRLSSVLKRQGDQGKESERKRHRLQSGVSISKPKHSSASIVYKKRRTNDGNYEFRYYNQSSTQDKIMELVRSRGKLSPKLSSPSENIDENAANGNIKNDVPPKIEDPSANGELKLSAAKTKKEISARVDSPSVERRLSFILSDKQSLAI